MANPTDQDDSRGNSPEEAFALLGNETRIGIVRALGERPEEPLSFSALRNRTDVADSGQFNYHLKQLVGSFVRRTEAGAYELTYAGNQVIGAIYSGAFNRHGTPLSFELDSECSVCDSSLRAEYENERVSIRCPDCDELISRFGFPPGAFENRSSDEFERTFHSWTRSLLSSVYGELCPTCAGRVHGSIITDSENFYRGQDVGIEHVCERCNESVQSSVGSYLLFHPAVFAFHHDHGINLTETPFWELPWLRNESPTLVSRDPRRVETTLELDGDCLDIGIDEHLSVSVIQSSV